MDISEYLPMFLAEGREHLQELNLAVVRIEEQPDDPETVDEIFRIAHSLKGMSATMGFAGMAALTHEMEDVFELLRQRNGGLERDAIDVLLECLDALGGRRRRDRRDRRGGDRARAADRAPAAGSCATARPSRTPTARRADAAGRPTTSPSWPTAAASCRSARRSPTTSQMPAVRAYMVLVALAELRRDARLRPDAGRRRRASPAARSTRGSSPSAPTPSCTALAGASPDVACPTSPRPSPRSRRRRAEAVDDAGRAGDAAGAPRRRRPPRAPAGRRTSSQGRLDRPRRRRAPRPAHALHGRARPAPHAGRGARRPGRRAGPLAGDAEPHAHVARAAGDGHAGPDDPGRGRLPALPAPRARPLDQARQAGRAASSSARTPSSTAPSSTRSATRSCTSSATRSTTASRRRRSASRPASPPTGTLEISARHAGGNVVITVARRRPRHRPRAGSPARPPSAG